MARGLYSAIGWGPRDALDKMSEMLRPFSIALDADGDAVATLPAHAREAGAVAVEAIRRFEARVGQRCGAHVGGCTTTHGPAIELGNRDHDAFGSKHEDAAAEVARALAVLLTVLGATGVWSITMD